MYGSSDLRTMASRIRWLEAKSAGSVDGGMVNRGSGAKSAERSSK